MAQRQSSHIAQAVAILSGGGLVAFATETVYGLGADATNSAAVRRIFAAKGRPSTNPLIVHVAHETVARRYAAEWTSTAHVLAGRFWPGPLTLVVAKTREIVAEATAGRDTVALRVPAHPLALELLNAFDGAVAAPSANRSGRVSPTTAGHVREELGERVDLILDGGPCEVGIESTVLDLTLKRPIILRPGGVSRRHIEETIGAVDVFDGAVDLIQAARSPGLSSVHYSPATPTFRFEIERIEKLSRYLNANPNQRGVLLVMAGMNAFYRLNLEMILMPDESIKYAHELYATLRAADARKADFIFIQMPPAKPEWLAVRDRLMRASRPLAG